MDHHAFAHSRSSSNDNHRSGGTYSDADSEPIHAVAREGGQAVAAATTPPPRLPTPTATTAPPMLEPRKLQPAQQDTTGSKHALSSSKSANEESTKGVTPRRIGRAERDEAELKKLFSQSAMRTSFFLWCQGLINNFHYNLVISGANALAANFSMTQYVALISFMNVFFGIIARIINAFVANRISYNIRMTLMSIGTMIGLLIVSFSGDIGGNSDTACFVVLLIGVAFTGTAYSYGETVVLSFVQRYPPNIVGAWGSGTGISGVITSLLFIALTSAGLSLKMIFLITLPLVVCYWLVFCFGLVAPHKVVTIMYTDGSKPPEEIILHRGFENKKMRELEARMPEITISDYAYRMFINFRGLSWSTIPAPATVYGRLPGGNVVQNEDTVYAPSADAMEDVACQNEDRYKPDDLYYPCCRFLCGWCSRSAGPRRWWGRNGYVIGLLHNRMFWFFFNLAVVYIAEYAAQFMAPFSFYCKESWADSFWIKNSYTITQFCYQLGVFISRSSLMCVKIPYVGVISILQVINAVGWLVQAKTKFISIHGLQSAETGLSFLLFAWMLFVGLLGGASYVNVFYLILCRGQSMQQKEEDAAIRKFLESRPVLNGGGDEETQTVATVPLKPARPAPREGQSEEFSDSMADGTNRSTAVEPEVVVTAAPSAKTSNSLKKLLKKKSSAASPDEKTKKNEVEGRIMHSDSESSEGELHDAELVNVPGHPDADPTLVRLGMANRKLTAAEADEIEAIRSASAEEWQRRRELSMSMGSLYAMVGICIGTLLDVFFTNTILKSKSTCVKD